MAALSRVSLLAVCFGTATCTAVGTAVGTAARHPVVTTSDGAYEGRTDSQLGISYFLGMRYAEPPLGGLRFREAQQVQPWAGTRDASNFGAACLQNFTASHSIADPEGIDVSEDCLFINIWRPHGERNCAEDESLPILVHSTCRA
jgi:para-nitrobenzyl esterase